MKKMTKNMLMIMAAAAFANAADGMQRANQNNARDVLHASLLGNDQNNDYQHPWYVNAVLDVTNQDTQTFNLCYAAMTRINDALDFAQNFLDNDAQRLINLGFDINNIFHVTEIVNTEKKLQDALREVQFCNQALQLKEQNFIQVYSRERGSHRFSRINKALDNLVAFHELETVAEKRHKSIESLHKICSQMAKLIVDNDPVKKINRMLELTFDRCQPAVHQNLTPNAQNNLLAEMSQLLDIATAAMEIVFSFLLNRSLNKHNQDIDWLKRSGLISN